MSGPALGFPRARGDVPARKNLYALAKRFSPRTRGCSGLRTPQRREHTVFPAHAGMFRRGVAGQGLPGRFPRARGDVPMSRINDSLPHKFSPRTRGCSDRRGHCRWCRRVFPAHAGMFRSLSKTHANIYGFPRARGDVPVQLRRVRYPMMFSPRTRGCSAVMGVDHHSSVVFPAHAGMFRPGQSPVR